MILTIALTLSYKTPVFLYLIVENGGSNPDAVWHHRSDESKDEAGGSVWPAVHGTGTLGGANLERTIVTNCNFAAYVCDTTLNVVAAVWGGA